MTDTFEVTTDFSEPWYTGAGVSLPEEVGLPVSVGGRGFLIDLSDELGLYHRYQVSSINLLNTQQASSSAESAQLPPEIWRRNVEDWHAGAGQAMYDRKDSLDARFYASQAIDCWTPWQISLVHNSSRVQTLPAGRSFLSSCGPDQLVAAAGTDMYWWGTDLTVAPTHVVMPSVIYDMTSDGQYLYTLHADGNVRKWTSSGVVVVFLAGVVIFGSGTRNLLRYIKGFLVLVEGPSIYDISTGAKVLIYLHPLATFTWRDACEGPVGYLLGGNGDKWSVYAIAIKQDATSLDVPRQAGPIPEGEVGYAIASYLGYVLVGLSTGWRFGATDGNGNVTLGRLIESTNPVRCFEGQDRFVWYGQSSDGTTPPAHLGRADLSTFTGPLTPAYASDLQSGVATGTVSAVTSFNVQAGGMGVRVFTIDGNGVWVEQASLEPTGYLEIGRMNFGTSDAKIGMYALLDFLPLQGSITLDVAYDNDPTFTTIATMNFAGATTAGKIRLEEHFTTARFRLTLNRDTDVTQGPTVTRFEIRAMPVPGRAAEIRLPLIVAEEYAEPNVHTRDVGGDLSYLLDLADTKRPFDLRIGVNVYRVYVTDYNWLPQRFTKDGAYLQGVCVLIAREVT